MMFLHGGWLHLILNMWTLIVPRRWRIGSGTAAISFISPAALRSLPSRFPESVLFRRSAPLAIAGVLGYHAPFPPARVTPVPILFIPLFFHVPAFFFVGLWFLIQILQGTLELVLPSSQGGVAWWAHVGGFVAGFVLGPLLVQPARRYPKYYRDEGILGFDTAGRV